MPPVVVSHVVRISSFSDWTAERGGIAVSGREAGAYGNAQAKIHRTYEAQRRRAISLAEHLHHE